MAKATPHKLYVNLSASQARKRLKGHGLGVRRVEAADRNQALIVHTATGDHLRQLRSLFSNVLTSSSKELLDTPVENLRNLGPTSAIWLQEIGVYTKSDLQRLGPVLAYQLVSQHQPRTSLNLLWAMSAALSDRDWREVTSEEKERLKTELEEA